MSVLTGMFGSSQDQDQDSEKLLHLFWNRAELKKEFASLRKEQFRLRDDIKRHKGETARVEQKLEQLESLLSDPRSACNVLAYYQLRGLAERCEQKVSVFAEQLKQQREHRMNNRQLVAWNENRERERKLIRRQQLDIRHDMQEIEDKLAREHAALVAASGLWHFFRRRKLRGLIDAYREKLGMLTARLDELSGQLESIDHQRPPETRGLDNVAKRSINCMILAFVQELYLLLGGGDFAELVKESQDRSVGATTYGDQRDCDRIIAEVARRIEVLESGGDMAAVLQRRAQLVSEHAKYRNDSEVVPVSSSVAKLFEFSKDGEVRTRKANLLGENYWGVARYLSR